MGAYRGAHAVADGLLPGAVTKVCEDINDLRLVITKASAVAYAVLGRNIQAGREQGLYLKFAGGEKENVVFHVRAVGRVFKHFITHGESTDGRQGPAVVGNYFPGIAVNTCPAGEIFGFNTDVTIGFHKSFHLACEALRWFNRLHLNPGTTPAGTLYKY